MTCPAGVATWLQFGSEAERRRTTGRAPNYRGQIMQTMEAKKVEPGVYKDQHGRRIEVFGTLANDQVVYRIGERRLTISRPLALKLWTKVEAAAVTPSKPKCPPADEVKGGNRIAAGLLLTVAMAAVAVFATLAACGKVEW